jgi:hypothetical protein
LDGGLTRQRRPPWLELFLGWQLLNMGLLLLG